MTGDTQATREKPSMYVAAIGIRDFRWYQGSNPHLELVNRAV